MLCLGLITGLILLVLIISAISWKIYTLIYANYTLGLLFPHPKYSSVVIFVVIILCFFILGIVRFVLKSGRYSGKS
jgi:hypothetical protein